MLRRIGRVLYAIWSPFFALQLGINTTILTTAALVCVLVTGHGRYSHLVGRFWSRLNVLMTGARVTLRGVEHIAAGQPYIVMANHQSQYDIFAVMGWLPMQFAFVLKHTIRKVVLLGYTLDRLGYIYVDRSNSENTAKSLANAAAKIRSGTSVFFFPEGTRSPDGRLIEFKSGGFRVAQAAGVPILPVTINGTRKIWRRGSLLLSPGRIDVTVHPPIAIPVGEERAVRSQLMEQVRMAIQADLRVD